MKLQAIIMASSLLFIVSLTSVQALTSTGSARPWQIRKEVKQEKRETVKAKITEKVKIRLQKIYQQIKTQLANRIDRLEKLADKIEASFPQWEAKGRDVSQAKIKLQEGRTALETAKTDLSSADVKLDELLASSDPKSLRDSLHQAVKKVRQDLVIARQALAETVRLLRLQPGGSNENL